MDNSSARMLSTETDKSFFTFQPKSGEEQVLSLFRIIDRLELPDKSTDKLEIQSRTKIIVSRLTLILNTFMVYRGPTRSWAELFHRDIYTPERCDRFLALLHVAQKHGEKDVVKVSQEMEKFVRMHRLDIDGLIIGKVPRGKFLMERKSTNDGSIPNVRASQSFSKAVDMVFTTLQRHSSRGSLLTPGDLCICRVPPSKRTTQAHTTAFARVLKVASTGVTVSFSPEEADSDVLPIEDVQTFTPEMQQMLNSPNGLAQLAINPFDEFWQTALRTVATELQAFLASSGAERIALAAEDTDGTKEDAALSVLDLPLLRKTQSLLAEFSPAKYPEMLERVRAVKAELAKRMILFGNKNDFFHPTLEKDLQLLESFSASDVLQKQVGALQHFIMVQIEELTAEESAFRSGKKKQQITDWWLKLIERGTDAFLTERGWKSDAVPDDYTSTPPSDMNAVQGNLEIVSLILDSSMDIYNTQLFVNELKARIYKELEKYCRVLRGMLFLTLSKQTPVFAAQSDPKAELDQLCQMQDARCALLVEMQMELPKDDWVASALADLKYISRMRDLEQQLEEGSFQEKVLDVVPISGLVMGQFVRLENELKTVQELWGSRKDHQATGASTGVYFGQPLERVMQSEATVPELVDLLTQVLLPKVETTEKLFRTRVHGSRVDALRTILETEARNGRRWTPALISAEEPHVLAALLLNFLQMLPKPLLGERWTPCLLRSLANVDGMHLQEVLRNIVQAMPARNQTLLRALLSFFASLMNERSAKEEAELYSTVGSVLFNARTPEDSAIAAKLLQTFLTHEAMLFSSSSTAVVTAMLRDLTGLYAEKSRLTVWRKCDELLANTAPVFLGASRQRLTFKEVFIVANGLATIVRSVFLGPPLPEEWVLLERMFAHCAPQALAQPTIEILKLLSKQGNSQGTKPLADLIVEMLTCNKLSVRNANRANSDQIVLSMGRTAEVQQMLENLNSSRRRLSEVPSNQDEGQAIALDRNAVESKKNACLLQMEQLRSQLATYNQAAMQQSARMNVTKQMQTRFRVGSDSGRISPARGLSPRGENKEISEKQKRLVAITLEIQTLEEQIAKLRVEKVMLEQAIHAALLAEDTQAAAPQLINALMKAHTALSEQGAASLNTARNALEGTGAKMFDAVVALFIYMIKQLESFRISAPRPLKNDRHRAQVQAQLEAITGIVDSIALPSAASEFFPARTSEVADLRSTLDLLVQMLLKEI